MESKKINQLATELAPDLSDLTIIGDPTTGISKKITLSQMASLFTGTVEEYANLAAFPITGVADTIYIALDTNILYRWNTGTSAYVELSPNIVSSLVFNDANGFDGTINLVGSVATLTITTALTTGSVGFIGASGALLQDNANFFWDDTNNRLGLGTNAPTTALDVFGSGIIGRINGTSTNNAYLGFASAGTNKWSVGNVQSDHRFRIFSEANTSELVSVLQTGEFGIGIANPTTKFHIDGAASALIANLDANVSVAKTLSFRSDNSNRINLEVSGTESGSNAGADLFIRRYSDLGALIDTPLTITRSTGALNFSGITTISNATASSSTTTGALIVTGGVGIGGALFGTTASFSSTLAVTGAATFSSSVTSVGLLLNTGGYLGSRSVRAASDLLIFYGGSAGFNFTDSTNSVVLASINNSGAATFTTTQTTGNALTINVDGSSGTPTGLRIAAGFASIGATAKLIQVVDSAGSNLFNVLAGGNVLMGTASSNGAKLQVSGSATFTSSLSMGTPGKQAIRAVPNQDTAATNLKTIMPLVEFGGTFTAMTLHILSTDGGGINSSIFHCSRNGGTTWTSTLVSSNGSANTITLTFGGTTSEPTLTLSGSSFNLFSVVYSVILR